MTTGSFTNSPKTEQFTKLPDQLQNKNPDANECHCLKICHVEPVARLPQGKSRLPALLRLSRRCQTRRKQFGGNTNEKFRSAHTKKRNGEYKIPPGTLVYTCFTSDFFVEDADVWRSQAWEMIRLRNDLNFLMITKRIDRFSRCLPADWGDGYDNVTICCTIENQACADYRLPIYQTAPIRHKIIICEPLLERIDLHPYRIGEWIEQVVAGGESGYNSRPCDFDWVMELRNICIKTTTRFLVQTNRGKIHQRRPTLPHQAPISTLPSPQSRYQLRTPPPNLTVKSTRGTGKMCYLKTE